MSFGTVILRRGITPVRDLWAWFELVSPKDGYAFRLSATVNVYDAAGTAVLA